MESGYFIFDQCDEGVKKRLVYLLESLEREDITSVVELGLEGKSDEEITSHLSKIDKEIKFFITSNKKDAIVFAKAIDVYCYRNNNISVETKIKLLLDKGYRKNTGLLKCFSNDDYRKERNQKILLIINLLKSRINKLNK